MMRVFSSFYIIILAIFLFSGADAKADDLASRLIFNDDDDATALVLLDEQPTATTAHPILDAADVIDYARKFLGRPYRSGGKTPKGFDCSGFTSYIFKNFDISLAASSGAQYRQGHPVDLEDVRPGDLLFFSGRSGRSSVGHVGMAVEVESDGTIIFIHSATSGGIRYDRYPDGGYYSRRYIGARRMIN